MPVQSSEFTLDNHTQIDGRRYVRETHTLTSGSPIVIDYLADVNADHAVIMAARVEAINLQLAESEFENVLNGN